MNDMTVMTDGHDLAGGDGGSHTLPTADDATTRHYLMGKVRPRLGWLTWLIFLHVLAIGCTVLSPIVFGRLVDMLSADDDAPRERIVAMFLILCAVMLMAAVFTWMAQRASWRFGEDLFMALRNDIIAGVVRLPVVDVERAGSGDVIGRTTHDVDAVSEASRIGLPEVLVASLFVILTTISSFLLDWRIAIASIAGLPLLVFSTRWYVRRSQPAYQAEMVAHARFDSIVHESISASRTIRLLRLNERVERTVHQRARAVANAEGCTLSLQTRWFPMAQLAYFLPYALVAVCGGWLAFNGYTTVGVVVAIALNVQLVVDPLDDLVYWADQVQMAWAALRRIAGVTCMERSSPAVVSKGRQDEHHTKYEDALGDLGSDVTHAINSSGVDARTPSTSPSLHSPQAHGVRLDHVWLSYEHEEPVICDVSMNIMPGGRVALIGRSGSGKSTLALAICGLMEPNHGTITHYPGEQQTRDGTTDGLVAPVQQPTNTHTMFIAQDPHLFAGTLRENLNIGCPSATDEMIVAALELMEIGNLADHLDQSADSDLLDPPTQQQIALARIMLQRPHLLVLDEATSLISVEQAQRLEERISQTLAGTSTIITIAHRVQSALDAGKVIVIDNHRIVQQGNPYTLLEQPGPFATICNAAQVRMQGAKLQ